MTKEQLDKEMIYHASLSPFQTVLKSGMISADDYRAIDTILRAQYSPLFVAESDQASLDNRAS